MAGFDIAEFLKWRRKEAGLSQVEVAERIHKLTEKTYQRIEQGKTDPRFKKQLMPILRVLDVTLQEVHDESFERPTANQCISRIQFYAKELRKRLKELTG